MIPRRTLTLYPGIWRDVIRTLSLPADKDYLTEFERKFAAYCGVRHAVATSSGTEAMRLILSGSAIKRGDHVLSVAYTIRPLVQEFLSAGYDLELVDISPEDFNLRPAAIETIRATDSGQAKKMLLSVLENTAGPARDIVLLNAGAAIYAAGAADSLESGIKAALRAIESGAALKKLHDLVEFTHRNSV